MANDETQARQRRAAINESRCRELNEQIESLSADAAFVEFVCECPRKTCETRVPLTLAEYEGVRRQPTRFLVAPGHADLSVERVVDGTERFQVVEKIELAAQVAAAMDPRS
jgi:hypothetical protein